MIRKEGKARWVYECAPCSEHQEAIDQFRAIEFGQYHEKTFAHAGTALSAAMGEVFNIFAEALKPAVDAMNSFAEMFAPPPNLPHDPALLRDRRKWGGK